MPHQKFIQLIIVISLCLIAINALSLNHQKASKKVKKSLNTQNRDCPEGFFFKNFNKNEQTNELTPNCEKCANGCSVCASSDESDCAICLSSKVTFGTKCL